LVIPTPISGIPPVGYVARKGEDIETLDLIFRRDRLLNCDEVFVCRDICLIYPILLVWPPYDGDIGSKVMKLILNPFSVSR
jgi:hypothetical protein